MNPNRKIIEFNNAKVDVEYLTERIKEYEIDFERYRKRVNAIKRLQSIRKIPRDKIKEIKQYNFLRNVKGNLLNLTEKREKKIIISMTSYPGRIKKTPAAIATLLQQTVKPDKIILWLGEDEFPDRQLPSLFEKIQLAGVEIRYRKDLGVHTRWYYGIEENPDDLIIIADDDIMYKEFIIEKLYNSYLKYPDSISAMAYLTMRFNDDGTVRKYDEWYNAGSISGNPSFRFMAIEVGGVLYPPHILPKEAFNLDDIIGLSPKQDDLWLKCMEVINGVKVAPAQKKSKVHGTVIRGTQRGLALGISNMIEDGNEKQLHNILKKYNQLDNGLTITETIASDSIN